MEGWDIFQERVMIEVWKPMQSPVDERQAGRLSYVGQSSRLTPV